MTDRNEPTFRNTSLPLIILTLVVGVALGWLGAGWVDGVMWLVAALLAYTLFNRVRQGLNEQQDTSPSA
jgi:CDP-diacylglycerol--glycerol-3-phosphate 3-phosphatidyltransferase